MVKFEIVRDGMWYIAAVFPQTFQLYQKFSLAQIRFNQSIDVVILIIASLQTDISLHSERSTSKKTQWGLH